MASFTYDRKRSKPADLPIIKVSEHEYSEFEVFLQWDTKKAAGSDSSQNTIIEHGIISGNINLWTLIFSCLYNVNFYKRSVKYNIQ